MVRFTLRLPDDLDKVLTELAMTIGVSKNDLIIMYLREKLKEKKK